MTVVDKKALQLQHIHKKPYFLEHVPQLLSNASPSSGFECSRSLIEENNRGKLSVEVPFNIGTRLFSESIQIEWTVFGIRFTLD